MAGERIGVLVREIKPLPQRDGDQNDDHLRGKFADGRILDERPAKQNGQTDEADHGDFGIHFQHRMRHMSQQFQRFAADPHHSQDDVNLLRHDDDADGRQHAMHGGGRKELAEKTQAKQPKADLDHAGDKAHHQRHAVRLKVGGGVFAPGVAKLDHCPQRNDDQAGGRPFDGQL